jgi:hypothetical protein
MYHNVHVLTSGLGCMEKCVKSVGVSGPKEMLKGWNAKCYGMGGYYNMLWLNLQVVHTSSITKKRHWVMGDLYISEISFVQ